MRRLCGARVKDPRRGGKNLPHLPHLRMTCARCKNEAPNIEWSYQRNTLVCDDCHETTGKPHYRCHSCRSKVLDLPDGVCSACRTHR